MSFDGPITFSSPEVKVKDTKYLFVHNRAIDGTTDLN